MPPCYRFIRIDLCSAKLPLFYICKPQIAESCVFSFFAPFALKDQEGLIFLLTFASAYSSILFGCVVSSEINGILKTGIFKYEHSYLQS